jgi:hypothetical protein
VHGDYPAFNVEETSSFRRNQRAQETGKMQKPLPPHRCTSYDTPSFVLAPPPRFL